MPRKKVLNTWDMEFAIVFPNHRLLQLRQMTWKSSAGAYTILRNKNKVLMMENCREIFCIARKMSVNPAHLRGMGIQISRLERSNKKNNRGGLTEFINNMNSAKAVKEVPIIEKVKTNEVVRRGRGRSRGRGGRTLERKASNNGNLNKFLVGESKNTSTTNSTTNDLPQVKIHF